MATNKPQILLTVDKELLEKIEDYRFGNRIPTRSEAIRWLIQEGLRRCSDSNQKKSKGSRR